MSQSAKFQEEICNQWQECENDEIDYYRKQFGDNPTSFKTFAWGYTRAYQKALNDIKAMLADFKEAYWDGNFGTISDDIVKEIDKQLKETGVEVND